MLFQMNTNIFYCIWFHDRHCSKPILIKFLNLKPIDYSNPEILPEILPEIISLPEILPEISALWLRSQKRRIAHKRQDQSNAGLQASLPFWKQAMSVNFLWSCKIYLATSFQMFPRTGWLTPGKQSFKLKYFKSQVYPSPVAILNLPVIMNSTLPWSTGASSYKVKLEYCSDRGLGI